MKPTQSVFITFLLSIAWFGCQPDTHPGEALARQYCGSCHAFPEPFLLPKKSWELQVLPAMGKLMGLQFFNGVPYQDVYDEVKGTLPVSDWQRIVDYYRSVAPEAMPSQKRAPVKEKTDQFEVLTPAMETQPATVFITIDPGNQRIYAASTADSSIYSYNHNLKLLQKSNAGGTLVDIRFAESLQHPGSRTGVVTDIGILHPNEGRSGSVSSFTRDTDGIFQLQKKIADSLPRPVQVTPADLDRNGLPDYLVCGFGNQSGALFWLQNTGTGFEKKMLRNQPGAVKAYIEDFNTDGELDIMVLFAQGNEGIFLYTNQGNGRFSETMLLQFPPVYGSSYFELQDMTGDGKKDIIYTCGDNADFTATVLKPYHGVYLFENKGANRFEPAFFFPINGCYKAVARDFDGDGDPDLAAISYFPDKEQPGESFVYLQNNGALQFKPYTIAGSAMGNWITLDAADADGDGDPDIVIGSLLPPDRKLKTGDTPRPPFLLLRNRLR